MTIGKILDMIMKYHNQAERDMRIFKPWAWAVYQTWTYLNKYEKERNNDY